MIMTDNEIVIALRAVAEKYKGKFVATCETNISEMATDAANHIERLCEENNRQKAEIERLEEILGGTSKVLTATCAGVRAEAIKEFAKRLKERLDRKYTIYGREYVLRHLRELVKEMGCSE